MRVVFCNISKAFDRVWLDLDFVRPVLKYCETFWDNFSNEDKKYIESNQTEAMKIVTGANKLCSIAKLNDDIRWEMLQVRRN